MLSKPHQLLSGCGQGLAVQGQDLGNPSEGNLKTFFPNNHLLFKSSISIAWHPCLSWAMDEMKEEGNDFISTSRMSKPTILGLNERTGFNWARLRRDSLTGWKILEGGSPSPKIFHKQCFLGSGLLSFSLSWWKRMDFMTDGRFTILWSHVMISLYLYFIYLIVWWGNKFFFRGILNADPSINSIYIQYL